MEQIIGLKNKVKKVKSAVNSAIPEIKQLLSTNVNEQTICGTIIKHLTPLFEFDEISIDPEYNMHLDAAKNMQLKEYIEKYRENTDIIKKFDCPCACCKKIMSDEEYKDTKRSKRPDIVIHKRNTDNKNDIVIEIKKNKKCLWDYLKLKYMTSSEGPYKYKLGIFIYFPHDKPKYIWFVDGSEKNL